MSEIEVTYLLITRSRLQTNSKNHNSKKRGYYEIGVHFIEKIKVIVKKGNCANNFQYRLNFSKKNLKVSYCQETNFFQPMLSRKDEKR